MENSRLQVVTTAPLPYLLSLPESPGQRPIPVLCFLHGYGEAAPMEMVQALSLHGPLSRTASPAARQNFIMVAPQLTIAGDTWYRHAHAVNHIVNGVREAHNGDLRRTYLTGFSFGGNGVFDLALIQPRYWAGLWAVDPTRVPREDPERPVWLSFGEVSRYRKAAFIQALDLENAEAGGAGDRLYLDQGQDHVGSAALAYADERIYCWLASKQLEPA